MDHRTVSILIEKLNAAKEIIDEATPRSSTLSAAIQNIAEIEKMLRQSGLIQTSKEWAYPATGWINRMKLIDTPGGLGFRYYTEDIKMDYSKDHCRVRFRTIK